MMITQHNITKHDKSTSVQTLHDTLYLGTPSQKHDVELEQIWLICGRCIYNETKEERNINMTDCIFKTMDNDVEQTLE